MMLTSETFINRKRFLRGTWYFIVRSWKRYPVVMQNKLEAHIKMYDEAGDWGVYAMMQGEKRFLRKVIMCD
jgi:hypothetical protein